MPDWSVATNPPSPIEDERSTLFRRIVANKAVQAALAIAWTLVVLEAGIALAMFVPGILGALPLPVQQGLSHLYRERIARHISLLPTCARYDPETFYTLKPGASCRFANVEYDNAYAINSAGLRDSEADLKAPEIVALGDSYTMGAGVEARESFVDRLERLVGRKILNAGVSSFGTEREFRMLKRLDTSNLKVVIVQYSDNDIGENLAAVSANGFNIRIAAEYARISAKHVRKTGYVPLKLSFYLVRDVLIGGYLAKRGAGAGGSQRLEEETAAFVKIFAKIRAVAPSAHFVVTELSGHGRARRHFLAALEKRFAGDTPVAVVAVEPGLPDAAYFILDSHLNALGHRLVAERLAPHLHRALGETRR